MAVSGVGLQAGLKRRLHVERVWLTYPASESNVRVTVVFGCCFILAAAFVAHPSHLLSVFIWRFECVCVCVLWCVCVDWLIACRVCLIYPPPASLRAFVSWRACSLTGRLQANSNPVCPFVISDNRSLPVFVRCVGVWRCAVSSRGIWRVVLRVRSDSISLSLSLSLSSLSLSSVMCVCVVERKRERESIHFADLLPLPQTREIMTTPRTPLQKDTASHSLVPEVL